MSDDELVAVDPPPSTKRRLIGIIGVIVAVASIAAVAIVVVTMDKRQPEPAGVGKYRFEHTKLADVEAGRCDPTTVENGARKVTWCYALPGFDIAGAIVEPHLYFGGVEPTSELIEIQLKVRGCNEDTLDRWMRANFAAPVETRGNRRIWENSHLWALALIPSEPGRCLVRMLPHSESAEISRLRSGSQ